ncbi:MAG: cytochrome c [Acidimicrobiia bacterium]
MSSRTIIILINLAVVAALVGFLVYRVVSTKRNPGEKTPDNLTPFFDDEVLEGAHLERVLGVALVALVIVLLGMVGYFMREPFRSAEADTAFLDRSVERGAVLFANPASEEYSSTVSLQCANCHGVDGGGGVAPTRIKSSDPRCTPAPGEQAKTAEQSVADGELYCLSTPVSWAAPNLQLASLRYSKEEITQIITYGRPGTPMPAWGVLSGRGSLNTQSIDDLVNYVESIGVSSDKAKKDADKDVDKLTETLSDPKVAVAADDWVAKTTAAEAAAQASLDRLGPVGLFPSDAQTQAQNYLAYAQEQLTAATEWRKTVRQASKGQKLFMNNCARCHTRGWSYFDPLHPDVTAQGTMGGGAFGPNLRNGDVNAQFSPPNGEAELFAWISVGAEAYAGYGNRGISSGRMPHFGAVLTKEQICEIMDYERNIDDPPASTASAANCLPSS